ncbi:MAG: hypothetical protein AAB551_01840 [Patescibacteria group bacterium]|mgnify:CR=1 FL=1
MRNEPEFTDKKVLTGREIVQAAETYCIQNDIQYPNPGALRLAMENFEIRGLPNIAAGCARIRKMIQEDPDLQKYEDIHRLISASMRLKIAIAMGFEGWLEGSKNEKESPRQQFISFLKQLGEGEKWNIRKLKSDPRNKKLYGNIYARSGWTRKVIGHILGSMEREMLQRNPYTPEKERKLGSKAEVGEFLKSFFSSLKQGEKWSMAKIRGQEINGISGETCREWIENNITKNSRGNVEFWMLKVFGKEGRDFLLARNPYAKDEIKKEDVRIFFMENTRRLPIGKKWAISTMKKWKSGDFKGTGIVDWLARNYPGQTEKGIREVLEKDAESILKRNPFEVRKGRN